jgi:chaperonin GroES
MSTGEKTMSTAHQARPTIGIQPLADRVVIRALEEPEPRYGRLHIPDTAKEKPTQGEVVAVGPGRFEKGERLPMELKVGDQVIYGKYSGTPFQVGDAELLIVNAPDILARIG